VVIKNKSYRFAFTMIELIFAIVIIAVSVMSLPMMTQITSKSIDDSLVQEAIFAAVAGLNEARTYRWDELSMYDRNTTSGDPEFARVVHTGNANDCTIVGTPPTSFNRRVGHINRKCISDLSGRPSTNNAIGDSLHEAAHGAESIYIVGATTSAAGYKKLYNSTLDVNLNASFGIPADNPNSNMKELVIEILDASDNSTIVQLKAYSANIGEVRYRWNGY